jgi:hypothetical protein
LVHDTCRFGNNFKTLLENAINMGVDKVALTTRPSMSIGLYSESYLKSVSEKILSIKNQDYSFEGLQYWKSWGVPNEDYILWLTPNMPVLNDSNHQMQFICYEIPVEPLTLITEYNPEEVIIEDESFESSNEDDLNEEKYSFEQ